MKRHAAKALPAVFFAMHGMKESTDGGNIELVIVNDKIMLTKAG